jgi:hypothetical protein
MREPVPDVELDPRPWDLMIPIKFRVSSGILSHRFHFATPPWRPGPAQMVETGYYWIRLADHYAAVVFDGDTNPKVVEAFEQISSVDDETVREVRYLAIHNAYECLVTDRDPDLSAVRHAIAHSQQALRKPETVASLKRRFGTTKINLRDYYHQKEFYRCLAQMLMAIDEALAALAGERAA